MFQVLSSVSQESDSVCVCLSSHGAVKIMTSLLTSNNVLSNNITTMNKIVVSERSAERKHKFTYRFIEVEYLPQYFIIV